MPTDSIKLGAGTLYYTDPTTGEKTPLGQIKEVETERAEPPTDGPIKRLADAMTEVAMTAEVAAGALLRSCNALWYRGGHVEYRGAMWWARTNRPRLLHLARRSKSKRVRKKNTRRILREYEQVRKA